MIYPFSRSAAIVAWQLQRLKSDVHDTVVPHRFSNTHVRRLQKSLYIYPRKKDRAATFAITVSDTNAITLSREHTDTATDPYYFAT